MKFRNAYLRIWEQKGLKAQVLIFVGWCLAEVRRRGGGVEEALQREDTVVARALEEATQPVREVRVPAVRQQVRLVPPGGSVRGERANVKELVNGCIEAKFCKKKYALENSRRDLNNALLCTVWNLESQNFR